MLLSRFQVCKNLIIEHYLRMGLALILFHYQVRYFIQRFELYLLIYYYNIMTDTPWNIAPIIVYRNNLRNAINYRAVIRKSIESSTQLIVVVANDTFLDNLFHNNEIKRYALKLDDNKTQNLPGYLPLTLG